MLFKDGPRGGMRATAILWDLPFNEKVSGWETHSETLSPHNLFKPVH